MPVFSGLDNHLDATEKHFGLIPGSKNPASDSVPARGGHGISP